MFYLYHYCSVLFGFLINLYFFKGYLTMKPSAKRLKTNPLDQKYHIDSELISNIDQWADVLPYMRMILQAQLIKASTLLHQVGVH